MIEMLVSIAILGLLSTLLVYNFRASATTKNGRVQALNAVVSDIRRAQSMALAGSSYNGRAVCGFGVHYVDPTTYWIYARLAPVDGSTCASNGKSRTYDTSIPPDPIVESRMLVNSKMVFRAAFVDIYFELPGARTYVNNRADPGIASNLYIGPLGGAGSSLVSVYTSGRMVVTE